MENQEYYSEIRPKSAFGLNLKELASYKELFFFFTWRDIKVKYKQTFLGFLWAILQPLLMMLIFTLFLGRALHVPSDGIPYPIFAFCGLMIWTIFSSGITSSGNSMINNAQIIKKIYFPRLIIPISSVLVAVVDFLMSAPVLIGLLLYFRQPVDILSALLLWPASTLLAVFGTLGPGCLLASLTIKYRDFRYVIPFMVQGLLFVTPVIYPTSVISVSWVSYILALNPMYSAVTLFRMPLVSIPQDLNLVIISICSSAVLFILGIVYFRRTEMYFADLA